MSDSGQIRHDRAERATMDCMSSLTSPDLARRIGEAGYYPDLVIDTLAVALAGEDVVAHLVRNETTFDADAVRRHLSVMALTATRLVLVHVDDHTPEMLAEAGLGDLALVDESPTSDVAAGPHAVATSEAVPLRSIGVVAVTHVVANPAAYLPGSLGKEITVTISWGAVSRIDLEPASCGDPNCDADHGLTGSITGDDLSVRVAADADGPQAIDEALAFARALSAATAR